MSFTEVDSKVVDNIRILAVELVAKANSGHQGLPMGFAPAMHVLCSRHLKYNPDVPDWINRDRLVLSAGHGSALLYTLIHLMGHKLSKEDLLAFRTLHSKTPGHPESRLTDGVEFTTGPLGQGLASAVGMAIAQKHLSSKWNTPEMPNINNHHIFVGCGDGCLQEGVTNEACSLAGHLGLGNLILLWDDNHVTIDGLTDIAFTEDVYKRYEALGWYVQMVEDGDKDLEAIHKAIVNAKKEVNRPSLIGVKTTIGYGSLAAGQSKAHSLHSKLPQIMDIRKKWGMKEEHYDMISEAYETYKLAQIRGAESYKAWEAQLAEWKEKYPEKYSSYEVFRTKGVPSSEEMYEILSKAPAMHNTATRKYSLAVLNAIAPNYPYLMGGSADLACSNLTTMSGAGDFQRESYGGRNLSFGIREHGMGSVSNGMAEYQYGEGFVPYCATFLVFETYMLAAIRMAALSELQVLFVLTHDSIGVGADGPTHQPVECLMQMRSVPNLYLFRPCDFEETKGSYVAALSLKASPSVLALSRQDLKDVEASDAKMVMRGAYVVNRAENPEVVLVASGSEVSACMKVAEEYGKGKVGVISMPCMELFDKQPVEYKKEVFWDCKAPVVSVECGTTLGWQKFSHVQIGVERYGASAHENVLYEHYGFSSKELVGKVGKVVEFYKSGKGVLNNFFNVVEF